MYLRHVLIIMSGIGAVGALLMALDFYRRLKEAERIVFINNIPAGPDSVLQIGMGHVLGLLALGLIFLALLLVLLPALKDQALVTAIEGARPVTESQAMPSPVVPQEPAPPAAAAEAPPEGNAPAENPPTVS